MTQQRIEDEMSRFEKEIQAMKSLQQSETSDSNLASRFKLLPNSSVVESKEESDDTDTILNDLAIAPPPPPPPSPPPDDNNQIPTSVYSSQQQNSLFKQHQQQPKELLINNSLSHSTFHTNDNLQQSYTTPVSSTVILTTGQSDGGGDGSIYNQQQSSPLITSRLAQNLVKIGSINNNNSAAIITNNTAATLIAVSSSSSSSVQHVIVPPPSSANIFTAAQAGSVVMAVGGASLPNKSNIFLPPQLRQRPPDPPPLSAGPPPVVVHSGAAPNVVPPSAVPPLQAGAPPRILQPPISRPSNSARSRSGVAINVRGNFPIRGGGRGSGLLVPPRMMRHPIPRRVHPPPPRQSSAVIANKPVLYGDVNKAVTTAANEPEGSVSSDGFVSSQKTAAVASPQSSDGLFDVSNLSSSSFINATDKHPNIDVISKRKAAKKRKFHLRGEKTKPPQPKVYVPDITPANEDEMEIFARLEALEKTTLAEKTTNSINEEEETRQMPTDLADSLRRTSENQKSSMKNNNISIKSSSSSPLNQRQKFRKSSSPAPKTIFNANVNSRAMSPAALTPESKSKAVVPPTIGVPPSPYPVINATAAMVHQHALHPTNVINPSPTGSLMIPNAVKRGIPRSKKDKRTIRAAAGEVWEDHSLSEWDPSDFRIFVGDLGNECSDEVLARAFSKYPSFQKAKVIREKRSNKTKGYGFVSFKDTDDFVKAMREMNGKYIGNRPVKLRRSTWKERCLDEVKKKNREKRQLGFIR